MDNIKLFVKTERELEIQILRERENMQSRHRNGIWRRKMCPASNEKQKATYEGMNGTTK